MSDTPEALKALAELVALEADGKQADECSIEVWERARAALRQDAQSAGVTGGESEARGSANDYAALTREVIEAIVSERTRQKTEEGHWPNGDNNYRQEELARAAAVYANPEIWNVFGASRVGWPWRADSYKPTTRRRDLIKAAALIVAQLERDHRASETTADGVVVHRTYKPFLKGSEA